MEKFVWRLIECEKSHGNHKGTFHAEIKTVDEKLCLLLVCKTCRRVIIRRIKGSPFNCGKISCCFKSIFKVYDTKYKYKLVCTSCNNIKEIEKEEI